MKFLIPCSTAIATAFVSACSPKLRSSLDSHVTTAEEQAKLTPDEVLKQLLEGNMRFRTGNETRRDHSEQVRKSAPGQYPKTMVLSCIDRRVAENNVRHNVNFIREKSPILTEIGDKGQIKIVGAFYRLTDGTKACRGKAG